MRFICCILLCCSIVFSCQEARPTTEWFKKNGKLKVLSTTAMINDLVTHVGGDAVDTLVLIQGELDPHSYQLVKGDDEILSSADLIFYNGLGLEHGPSLRAYLLRHPGAIALGDRLQKEHPDHILQVKGQTDPHIWMDVHLFSEVIPFIVEALAKARPDLAPQFQTAGEKTQKELKKVDQAIKKSLQEIPEEKRYLVTSHDAFNYFAKAYLVTPGELQAEERFRAPEGLAPESQLSVADLQKILEHVEKYHVHVLFTESNVSPDSLQKIVSAGREKGLLLRLSSSPLYSDAMGGGSYLDMMQHNADLISSELQKP